jgi:hypothetical protein
LAAFFSAATAAGLVSEAHPDSSSARHAENNVKVRISPKYYHGRRGVVS